MAIYNVFESVNMRSVHFAERIFDAVCEEPVENGTFGYLEGLAEGESNIYKFVKGTKEGAEVVVANNPAWDYDTCRITNQRRDIFIIEAGVPFRAYVMKVTDEFGTAIEGFTADSRETVTGTADFTATPVYATIDASGKLVASTSETEGAVMSAQIMRKRMVSNSLVTKAHVYGSQKEIYEVKVNSLAK